MIGVGLEEDCATTISYPFGSSVVHVGRGMHPDTRVTMILLG